MNIIQTLKPKEAIAHFNKIYIVPFLKTQGFDFKENILEYHRKTTDFKQVIWHRCDKNNMVGHYVGFGVGYYNLCPKFKNWYKNKYAKEPIGGDVVIGYKDVYEDKWNKKYNSHLGSFGYDLIEKNIEDQFLIIRGNLENVFLPTLEYYKDFDSVIDNPNEVSSGGFFDLFSSMRQIEHCLFKGYFEKANLLAKNIMIDERIPMEHFEYRDTQLKRIFQNT